MQHWAQGQIIAALQGGAAAVELRQPSSEAIPAELASALAAAGKMLMQDLSDTALEQFFVLLARLVAEDALGTAGAVGAVLRQLPIGESSALHTHAFTPTPLPLHSSW